MNRTIAAVLMCAACCLSAGTAGCGKCLEKGSNGVPSPEEGEFQLVFSNIVSRETSIYVNGEKVGEVCDETEYATVGNFPVGTHTIIKMSSMISSHTECHVSPNCSSNCDAQECHGEPVIDTTPFSGRKLSTGLIWRQ